MNGKHLSNVVDLKSRRKVSSVVFGICISLWFVLGYTFDLANNFKWIKEHPLIALATFIGCTFASSLAFYGITHLLSMKKTHNCVPKTKFAKPLQGFLQGHSDRFLFIMVWAAISAGWLPWIIQGYPGATDSDTVTQLLQYYALQEASNHHPWFDTLIFGAFWDLGITLGAGTTGLQIYCIAQSLCLSAGLSMLLLYFLRWQGGPITWLSLLALFAIYPAFPMFADNMMKDSLNAIFWLPWLILYADAVISQGKTFSDIPLFLLWIALALLCCMTKKTSLYIIIPSVLILMVTTPVRPKMLISLVVIIAAIFLWESIALPFMGIPQKSAGEMMSIPAQQVARYARDHEITDSEEAILRLVFVDDSDKLAKQYDPRRSDKTKGAWKSDSSLQDKMRFCELYISMSIRHPITFAAATWNNVYDYFYPVKTLKGSVGPAYSENYVAFWKSRCKPQVSQRELEDFLTDTAEASQQIKNRPPLLKTVWFGIMDIPLIGILFSEALVCSWLPLLYFLYCWQRRDRNMYVILVPYLLVLFSLVCGPISLVRYMAPVVFGITVLLALLLARPQSAPTNTVHLSSGYAHSHQL